MNNVVLYCKSYEGDVLRALRLAQSVEKFNCDGLRFYISVPSSDRSLFLSKLGTTNFELLNDEDIVRANPRVNPDKYTHWDGRVSQQVIKSEFWRLVQCNAYVCIDSDAVFLRDFHTSNFLHVDGTPYTVMHQHKELLQLAANVGRQCHVNIFHEESKRLKGIFNRVGPDYEFGPPPLIWSPHVWNDLDKFMLEPKGLTLWDAIQQMPIEIRWYGESLLKYKSIPLHPIEPIMRFYHYDWQWKIYSKLGETPKTLADNYLGAVFQSNWEFEFDYGVKKRPLLSRFARRIKRWLR